jgi:hypothetical protein
MLWTVCIVRDGVLVSISCGDRCVLIFGDRSVQCKVWEWVLVRETATATETERQRQRQRERVGVGVVIVCVLSMGMRCVPQRELWQSVRFCPAHRR